MVSLTDIDQERQRLLQEMKRFLAHLRQCTRTDPEDLCVAVRCLDTISRTAYEDLNQLQHEALLLDTAELIKSRHPELAVANWHWNPRQGGGASEPDLRATLESDIQVSVEATCSRNPQGKIAGRINDTLDKLSNMPGTLYYSVTDSRMSRRARKYIQKKGYSIEVLQPWSTT